MNNHWSIQNTKSKFIELLNSGDDLGPQIIRRVGLVKAILATINTWRKVQNSAKPSLKSFLLSDRDRFEMALKKRGSRQHRKLIS
jgi:hypothetical protein